MPDETVDFASRTPVLIELFWRFPRARAKSLRLFPKALRPRLVGAALRRGYGDFNRLGSVATVNFTDDFELYQAAEVLGTVGTFHGPDALNQVVAELREAFDGVRFEPLEIRRVGGDGFLAIVRFRGTGRGSGIAVDRPIGHLWRVRGPFAARLEVYWEPAEAQEAASRLR